MDVPTAETCPSGDSWNPEKCTCYKEGRRACAGMLDVPTPPKSTEPTDAEKKLEEAAATVAAVVGAEKSGASNR